VGPKDDPLSIQLVQRRFESAPTMAVKPNYSFEKRQRELEKKRKKAEKAQRKASGGTADETTEDAGDAGADDTSQAAAPLADVPSVDGTTP
jgi:hypothetical protein